MTKIKIDKIIRSKRKTLALEIAPDASLIIRAPVRTSLDYIEKIILKKQLWIQKNQKIAHERHQNLSHKEFVNGEEFLYLGEIYRLFIVDNETDTSLLFDRGFLLSKSYLPYANQVFINWYKERAYEMIKQRLDWYVTLSGFKYNTFRITNAQKRWGSCSAKNNLNISWRLIMAPLAVIDYVVIHELVHTIEKNHLKGFWGKVKTIMPSYQQNRKWLKDNGQLLTI